MPKHIDAMTKFRCSFEFNLVFNEFLDELSSVLYKLPVLSTEGVSLGDNHVLLLAIQGELHQHATQESNLLGLILREYKFYV